MLTSGLIWTSKWVVQAVMANRIHRQGLDGCPQKKFGIFEVEIRITQKMVCYSTRKSSKWGVCSLRGSFDLPNWADKLWWPTVCIEKVLTDVHENIWHFLRRNPDHPKKVCYSTRKSSKWIVCSLRGSFDPPNGSDKPWWPTVCIDKVLTDVHEKVWYFWRQNPDHPKNGVL